MGRIRIVDTSEVYDRASRQRRVFHGSVAGKRAYLGSPWPRQLVHIGKCVAQIYWSNKALNGGQWETYKHIAEAGQDLFINPETTTLFDKNGREIAFVIDDPLAPPPTKAEKDQFFKKGVFPVFGCSLYEIASDMPRYITTLAEDRGLQVVLQDGSYYEMRLPHSTWGSGVHPHSGETFLVLYSKEGIHFLVTGSELDITADGIVG